MLTALGVVIGKILLLPINFILLATTRKADLRQMWLNFCYKAGQKAALIKRKILIPTALWLVLVAVFLASAFSFAIGMVLAFPIFFLFVLAVWLAVKRK